MAYPFPIQELESSSIIHCIHNHITYHIYNNIISYIYKQHNIPYFQKKKEKKKKKKKQQQQHVLFIFYE